MNIQINFLCFSELNFFGYSFDPEKAYLLIGEVFKAIPAVLHEFLSNQLS